MVQNRVIVGFIAVVSCLGVLKSMNQWSLRESNSLMLERLLRSEKNWRDGVNSRHKYIATKKDLESFQPWGDTGFTVVWNLFAPTFDCPYMKQRVGSIGDGGKWLCGFEVFEETKIPCVVYSFGVSRESSFEAEILQKTNCEIFAYDMTVIKMGPQINKEHNPRVHFKKIGLGVNTTHNLKTLNTLMEENGHKWIDIFKIDIEGAEFEILDGILKSFQPLPFGQMQIEIHVHNYGIPNFYRWFERLEAAGLRPFNSEINLSPCVRKKRGQPTLMEYSFLNVYTNHALVPEEFLSELQSIQS